MRLRLETIVSPPPGEVYAVLVDSEQLARWWGPTGFRSSPLELDVRAGGSYRIAMQPPDGDAFELHGSYLEVDPPRRLVYTFEYSEPDPDDVVTVVELSLLPHADGTRIVLEQHAFATAARLDLHRTGWSETLERLSELVGRG